MTTESRFYLQLLGYNIQLGLPIEDEDVENFVNSIIFKEKLKTGIIYGNLLYNIIYPNCLDSIEQVKNSAFQVINKINDLIEYKLSENELEMLNTYIEIKHSIFRNRDNGLSVPQCVNFFDSLHMTTDNIIEMEDDMSSSNYNPFAGMTDLEHFLTLDLLYIFLNSLVFDSIQIDKVDYNLQLFEIGKNKIKDYRNLLAQIQNFD